MAASLAEPGPGPGLMSLALRTLVAGFVVLLLVRYVTKILRMRRLTAPIPGPTPVYPFIGNFLEVAGSQEDFLYKILSLYKTFGRTWRLWVGDHLMVFIGEPDDLAVLVNHPALQDKPGLIYNGFETLLNCPGFLSMPGAEAYRRMRKALTPAFSLNHMRSMLQSFDKHTADLCRKFEPFATSKKVVNMVSYLERLTVDVIYDTVINSEANEEKDRAMLADVLKSADELVMWLAFRPWFQNKYIRKLFCSRAAEIEWVSRSTGDVVKNAFGKKLPAVEESRRQLQAELDAKMRRPAHPSSGAADHDSDLEDDPPKDVKSILDHFLSSRHLPMMSNDEIVSNMAHISAAGLATSSTLLMMTVLLISMFPDVQKNLHKELDDIFGSGEDRLRPTTEADMARLQYLERVVKETLRLFPAVHTIARYASKDVTLPSTGYVVPKGAVITATLYQIHRDERFFPDPEVFDPDRHLPDVSSGRPVYSYTPFSAGVRNCVGQKYGMIYMKGAISNFLRRYRILPSPDGPKKISDIKVLAGASLNLVGGVNVILERRDVASA